MHPPGGSGGSTQVSIATITAELKALGEKIGDGFTEINRRLDDHKEDVGENAKRIVRLEERVHIMELSAAKGEGSNYDARLEAMHATQKDTNERVSALENYKWYLMGAIGFAVLAIGSAGWILKMALDAVGKIQGAK